MLSFEFVKKCWLIKCFRRYNKIFDGHTIYVTKCKTFDIIKFVKRFLISIITSVNAISFYVNYLLNIPFRLTGSWPGQDGTGFVVSILGY
jgi:hypothetical protein